MAYGGFKKSGRRRNRLIISCAVREIQIIIQHPSKPDGRNKNCFLSFYVWLIQGIENFQAHQARSVCLCRITKSEGCRKMMVIKWRHLGCTGVGGRTFNVNIVSLGRVVFWIVAGKITQETIAGKMDDAAEDGGGSNSVGSAKWRRSGLQKVVRVVGIRLGTCLVTKR